LSYNGKRGSSYGNQRKGSKGSFNYGKRKIKPSETVKLPRTEMTKQPIVGSDGLYYPDEAFVIAIHEEMINRYGGYRGLDVGMKPYAFYLKEAEEETNIYRKAAALLVGIATGRMFQDGQHRTAQHVAEAFLELNGAKMNEEDNEKAYRFIKDVRKYDIDEISDWIENGKKQS
jgi:death-on-curing protein